MDLQNKPMTNLPTIGVSILLFRYYPNNLTMIPVLDEETNKWSAAVVKCKPKELNLQDFDMGMYRVIYSLDNYVYPTQNQALDSIQLIVEKSVSTIRTMCN